MVYIFIPFFFLVFKDFLIALLLSHIFTSTDAKKTKWGFKAKQGLRCLLFKCHTVCKSQKINHLVYIYPTTCLNTKVRKITHFLVSWRKYYYQLCLHITKISTTSKKIHKSNRTLGTMWKTTLDFSNSQLDIKELWTLKKWANKMSAVLATFFFFFWC